MGPGADRSGDRLMDLLAGALGWLLDPINWRGPDGIPIRVGEHVAISGASIIVAVLIAVPIGLWIGHTGRLAFLAVNAANLGRAIPSYAVMAMILPVSLAISPQYGLALIPTFVAMTLLAIPPILVNTYAGIREVDRDIVEAGRGMGMRERQILRRVEIPLAIPVLVGGIRTAAVQVVATATLGAVFGLGGLGRYLIDGIARRDFDRLIAGVVLVAMLAILTEIGIALVQRRLSSRGLEHAAARAFRRPADLPAPGGGAWTG
jgi:osmoprotectant transport system permease protein